MGYHLVFFVVCFSATVAVSSGLGEGACYRQYIPAQSSFPHARCRHLMGGNPVTMGVFIRNDKTCCRRRQANGWGSENNCKSCSSVRGILRPWGNWSICSKPCGWGEQTRHRDCSNAVCEGVRGRRKTETRNCMWKVCCPVDGTWGGWSHWSGCRPSCGEGLKDRTRSCSSPSPSCGGKPCRGFPRQIRSCRIGQCASWSSWTSVSPCSVTCGIGNVQRTRACNSPLGESCSGEPVDYLPCDAGSCAVDGGWCSWNPWSTCTSTCQYSSGTRKRSRWCECPVPQNGGHQCSGSDGEVEKCSSEGKCPINGGWSAWLSWTDCSSAKCSTSPGVRLRTRKCNSPPPKYGGTCEGSDVEEKRCINLDNCDTEGVYGEWSAWSPCTFSCGSCAIKIRERKCFHIVKILNTDVIGIPKFYCDESKKLQTEECKLDDCPEGKDPCDQYEEEYDDEEEYGDEEEYNLETHEESHFEHYYDTLPSIIEEVNEDYSGDEDYNNQINNEKSPYYGVEENGDESEHRYFGQLDRSDEEEINGILSMMDEEEEDSEADVAAYFGQLDRSDEEEIKGILSMTDEEEEDSEADVADDAVYLLNEENKENDILLRKSEKNGSEGDTFVIGSNKFSDKKRIGTEEFDAEQTNYSGEKQPYENYDEGEWPYVDGSGAGDSETHGINSTETTMDWCDKLNHVEGEDAARASGCCDILTKGLTNDTDRARLQECFVLHYKYVIGDADGMLEDGINARGALPRCRYRGKARMLQTICCAFGDCSRWSQQSLQNQCYACRRRNACQSCHRILLSG